MAIFLALWESVSLAAGWMEPRERHDEWLSEADSFSQPPREMVIEAVRSYAQPTLVKLRLGCLYQQSQQATQAQRLYEEVLWETRDSEEVAVVRELLIQLDENKSHPLPQKQLAVPISPRKESPAETKTPQAISHELGRPLEANSLATAGRPLLYWMENSLPLFVELTLQRLARYIEAVGEHELTRVCTDAEFRQVVVRGLVNRFPKEVTDLNASIHPDGIVGTGTLHLGTLAFRIASRVGISLVDGQPHAVIYEAKVGTLEIPEPVLKFLERRINRVIARRLLPLKIKRCELREGAAFVSVEIA